MELAHRREARGARDESAIRESTLETRSTAEMDTPATGAAAVLVFLLDDVRCALPLDVVREIVRAVRITPLPTAPDVVEGVIDVRGDIVPVLDLRARLGLDARSVSPDNVLILAEAAGRTVAVRADRVEWIAEAEAGGLVEPERIARGIGYLAGVARTREGMVMVHDLAAFLRQGEAEALDAALAARPEHGPAGG